MNPHTLKVTVRQTKLGRTADHRVSITFGIRLNASTPVKQDGGGFLINRPVVADDDIHQMLVALQPVVDLLRSLGTPTSQYLETLPSTLEWLRRLHSGNFAGETTNVAGLSLVISGKQRLKEFNKAFATCCAHMSTIVGVEVISQAVK